MFYFHLERTVIEEMNVYFYLHLLFKIEIFYVYTENKKYFLQLLTRIKHQPNIFNTRILSWSGFIFPYFIIFFFHTPPIFPFHVQEDYYIICNHNVAVSLILLLQAKKNNTLVSGNAGDEKSLHPGGCKKNTLYQFN